MTDEEDFLELRLDGRAEFSAAEAERIRAWIGSRAEDESELLGFVLSDWTRTPEAFSPADFDELVSLGFVEIS